MLRWARPDRSESSIALSRYHISRAFSGDFDSSSTALLYSYSHFGHDDTRQGLVHDFDDMSEIPLEPDVPADAWSIHDMLPSPLRPSPQIPVVPLPPATPPLTCLDLASPLPHHAPCGAYPVSNGGVHPPQLVPIPSSSTAVPQIVPICDQVPDISIIHELNPMDMQGQAGPSRGFGEGSPLVPGTAAQTTTIPMRTVLRRTATRDSCPPEVEPLQRRVRPPVTPTPVNSSLPQSNHRRIECPL